MYRSFSFFLPLFLLSLVLVGCQPKGENLAFEGDFADGAENNDVLLAGEDAFEMPLSATFSSDSQHFSYALSYDGAVLKLTDADFPGASVMGPSFKVEGGGTIGAKTLPVSELQDLNDKGLTPLQVGLYQVYRYQNAYFPKGTREDVKFCDQDFAVVPYGEEGLQFQLTTCEGEDASVGLMALDSLLEGLEIH